jgi:hypothetical protein
MKKLLTIVVILLISAAVSVSADLIIAPYAYTVQLPQNREFHMSPADSEYAVENDVQSGLYERGADGTLSLIYPYTGAYYYESNLTISSDGRYIAAIPWADSDSVVFFYKEGALQKQYTVYELMKDAEKREFTASHFFWENTDKRFFDENGNVLSIETLDKVNISFDITTGKIVSAESSGVNVFAVSVSVVTMAAVLLAVCATVSVRRKKHAQ